MLLGNRTVLQKSLATFRNGTATAGAYAANTINNLTQSGRNRNIFVNDGQQNINRANAVPIGYTHPYNWVMPQKNGGMASLKYLSGLVTFSGEGSGGLNAEASISGSITVTNAELGLIVSAEASLSASGSITNAELAAVLDMIANALSASGTLNTPILGALAGLSAGLSGTITVSAASMVDSIGYMEADILPYTTLSPEGLATSLLDNNDIDTGYSLRDALKIILAATAGKVSGAETTTITFRNLPDSVDRIVATVDSNGNRTALTYDVGD